MYCSSCGSKMSQEAKFCKNCGSAINDNSKSYPETAEASSIIEKEFNFRKVFAWSASIITIALLILYGLMGELEKDATGTFFGIILLSIMLGVLITFVIKWTGNGATKEKPLSLTNEEATKFKGLEGWLTLVILGLFITTGYGLYLLFDTLFNSVDYAGTSLYKYDLINGIVISTLGIYNIYLFFKKKRSFKKFYIVQWIYLVIVGIVTYAIASSSGQLDQSDLDEYLKIASRNCFGAIIWGSYIAKSKRVKATFIE